MIPNTATAVKVETNFDGGPVVEMGFDEGAIEHLMGVLSEQYADPIMAIVREYITNALDSHREAGQTRPVKVTLPTMFKPVYTVQDFGIGMNLEDIQRTYSKYGASTKRGSNDYNGTLGIGSKSAFAYTDQFTVIGVKDGIRTTAIVARNSGLTSKPVMQIVSETATDEPNGVTIQIPVTNSAEVVERVKKFAAFLPVGAVEVDGRDLSRRNEWQKVVENVTDKAGNTVINAIYLAPRNMLEENVILMGNVAYPADLNIPSDMMLFGRYLIAEVPIGVVQFAPSREDLMELPLTKKVQEFISETYVKHLAESGKRAIAEAPTKAEALIKYHEFLSVFARAGIKVTYNGIEFPTSHMSPNRAMQYRPSVTRGAVETSARISYAELTKHIFVKGYPNYDKFLSSTHKAKIKLWAEQKGIWWSPPYYYYHDAEPPAGMTAEGRRDSVFLVDDVPHDEWLADIEWVDWSEIAAIKLPSSGGSGYGGTAVTFGGKHYIFDQARKDSGVNSFEQRHVDPKNDKNLIVVLYAQEQKETGWDNIKMFKLFRDYMDLNKTATIVGVYAGRKDKFLRDFPKAKVMTFKEMSREVNAARARAITDADIRAAAWDHLGYWSHQTYQAMHAIKALRLKDGEVDDPKFAGLDSTETDRGRMRDTAMVINGTLVAPAEVANQIREKFKKAQEDIKAHNKYIADTYPLLALAGRQALTPEARSDMIDYINNKFNSLNGKAAN